MSGADRHGTRARYGRWRNSNKAVRSMAWRCKESMEQRRMAMLACAKAVEGVSAHDGGRAKGDTSTSGEAPERGSGLVDGMRNGRR